MGSPARRAHFADEPRLLRHLQDVPEVPPALLKRLQVSTTRLRCRFMPLAVVSVTSPVRLNNIRGCQGACRGGSILELISQNVLFIQLQKVNLPTKSATYCLLLLITILC